MEQVLSIEEKARLYDEAVINGSRLWESNIITRESYEYIFPELKESEDERIRKALLNTVKYYHPNESPYTLGISKEQIIAWLEKQGKQESTDKVEPKFKVGDWITDNTSTFQIVRVENEWYYADDGDKICFDVAHQYYHLANAGYEWDSEKKELKKVGPKFNVYDWVVTDKGDTVQIGAVNSGYYTICNGMDFNMSFVDKCWHRWTIDEAKDGDVLVNGDEIVIFKENNFNEKDLSGCMFVHCSLQNNRGYWYTIGSINPTNYVPATKEQRDTLFAKMKEAGYEWDEENKELKKIEQNPTWSEEDENKLLLLEALCDDQINSSTTYSTMYREMHETKDWLKSLKQRIFS